jgi:SAM-dependent methyltransferase
MLFDREERYNKFFYAQALNAGMYDVTVDLVVPLYQLMHEMMTRLLELSFRLAGPSSSSSEEKVILDIGSGTGTDSIRILRQWPKIKVVAVDFSKPMNDVFRRSFRDAFPSEDIDSRVRFVEEDITCDRGQPAGLMAVLSDFTQGKKKCFDAVVTALTLHDFERNDKLEAYRRAFKVLKLLIPLKVVSDSDLIPVAASEVKPVVFGAKRRWHSYGA